MARVLAAFATEVVSSDIDTGLDFLNCQTAGVTVDSIVTNPPYALADLFIVHALRLMERANGQVAMLLRTDFDHAKCRQHLFQHPAFSKKLVLTKRIKWFEDSKGQPSFNHAWHLWDWKHSGPPIIVYGPSPD
jgi:hypothetical protein